MTCLDSHLIQSILAYIYITIFLHLSPSRSSIPSSLNFLKYSRIKFSSKKSYRVFCLIRLLISIFALKKLFYYIFLGEDSALLGSTKKVVILVGLRYYSCYFSDLIFFTAYTAYYTPLRKFWYQRYA